VGKERDDKQFSKLLSHKSRLNNAGASALHKPDGNRQECPQEDKEMKSTAHLCVAGMLAVGMTALAQEPPKQDKPAGASADQITVTGCIQREADYRQAKDAGKGGVAGTGVGAGNEFVLINASRAAGGAGPTGTSGSAMAYELTGPNEGKVSEYVGRRVEITGKIKAAETTASGRPRPPPSGVDVASKDLKLRELEVASVKEATGTCPSSAK
jgi:hypothetical protein